MIESYKDRILSLEIEVEYFKQDKERYEKLLFEQLGIGSARAALTDDDRQVIHRPMSPLRMRQSLEQASRNSLKHSQQIPAPGSHIHKVE